MVSIALTLALILFQRHVIRRTESLAVQADSAHYFSDFLANLTVIAALVLSHLLGWWWIDPLFGLAVALFISWTTLSIGRAALDMLMDREMDDQDRDRIKRWCDECLVPFGRDPNALPPNELEAARRSGQALGRYVRDLVAETRARPRGDLLSALVQAEEAGDRLTEDELFASVVLLLIAGHENLTGLLGCGTLALLQHPDQLQRLRAEPALLPNAVEELIRWVTPNQFIRRIALEDVTIGGTRVRRDQALLLVLAAANRDPARFDDPDRLDLGRAVGWHLAFGHGFHYCLGVALARLEGEVFFGTLLARCPGLRLADDRIDFVDNFNMRQVKTLPVAF